MAMQLSSIPTSADAILKAGGEGTIVRLDSGVLARVYHPSQRTELRSRKVLSMVKKHVTGRFAKNIAWPEEAIMKGQCAVNFTMQKLKGKPSSALLSNDERFKTPWDIRLRIRSNAVILVDALHRAGMVFEDLNADNLAYIPSGDVHLFDADSLQVRFGERTFHRTIKHSDFRPRRRQGKQLLSQHRRARSKRRRLRLLAVHPRHQVQR